jgi:hypothetical protein
LKLEDSLLIGKGNERLCYIHPEDDTKVIKVAYKEGKIRDQNRLEYIYNQHLEKRGVNFAHLSKCYGWVNVGQKEGLVFERVLNFDNTPALTLSKAIEEKRISIEYAQELLEELRQYLEENVILFIDVALDNIMCQKQADGSCRLIIIDGLGARRPGLKFWLYRHIRLYAKYKVKSQWQKVLVNFNKAKKALNI